MVNLPCVACESLLRLEIFANLVVFFQNAIQIVDVKIEVKIIIEYSKPMGKFACKKLSCLVEPIPLTPLKRIRVNSAFVLEKAAIKLQS